MKPCSPPRVRVHPRDLVAALLAPAPAGAHPLPDPVRLAVACRLVGADLPEEITDVLAQALEEEA